VSLWAAGQLLLVASWRNRVRKTLKRLREPRYLVGAALVALYFTSFLGRAVRPRGHALPTLPFDVLPFVDAALFGLAVVALPLGWLFGSRTPLRFTEAEVQLLFPAPLTRRSILHYKLVTGLLRVGFGAAVSAFFFSRSGLASFWRLALAAWLALGIGWMHLLAAGLMRSSLLQHGRTALRRRLGTLAVLAGVVALGTAAARHLAPPPDWSDLSALPGYLTHLLATPPLSWLVAPAKAIVRVGLSSDWGLFARGLLLSSALFAVHYLWVLRSDQAFEDSALVSAERRARTREARRYGRRAPLEGKRLRRPWVKLRAKGRPEWAIAWKNAVACQRLFALPLVILVLSFLFPLGALALELLLAKGSDVLFASGAIALGAALAVALFGPLVLRADLRQDVKQLDILRALPLRGWQVVLSEMAGPWILLAGLQAALLISALLLLAAGRAPFGWGLRLAVAASVLLLAPMISAAMLLVQNAGVVLFPAWVSFEPGQRGLEAMGQRMLSFLGTSLVIAVGLLPAVAVGGALYMLLYWLGGPVFGILPATVLAALVLGGEVALGIRLTGRAFDTLDVSLD
jgi:hypothetical protein